MANTDHGHSHGAATPAVTLPDREDETSPLARAVALKDSSQAGNRPRIIAKGAGGVAEQILQIAWANDVKVREDADLVEVLSALDVESDIPIEAFAAVAEILSYVYRANADTQPLEGEKE